MSLIPQNSTSCLLSFYGRSPEITIGLHTQLLQPNNNEQKNTIKRYYSNYLRWFTNITSSALIKTIGVALNIQTHTKPYSAQNPKNHAPTPINLLLNMPLVGAGIGRTPFRPDPMLSLLRNSVGDSFGHISAYQCVLVLDLVLVHKSSLVRIPQILWGRAEP